MKKKVESHIHWEKLQDKYRVQGFWLGLVAGVLIGIMLTLNGMGK